ncbi:response regulator [Loktanella sp. M215]|uniref:response regulator n=1 Tax=Loktanella sp. M215 TaxID=2675431 RepID=UPI001F030BDF|nr:response regulator [Loktanella sp. M215]MCF7702221.1 response regulator [Loktanella sp. M215]
MVFGYILLGVTVGFFGAAASFGLGASFWSVLGIYTLSGFAGMIVLPLIHAVTSVLSARAAPQADTDHDIAFDPVRDAAPLQAPQPAPNAVFTILAVDDDPFILDLVDTIGASAGAFDIVMASSGAEALDLLASADRTFNYLLFDISMPQMSGIDLCRRVRLMPRYQDVPLVMLTALRDMDHIAEAFRAGATDYATKPFDIEALRKRFQAAHAAFKAQTDVAQIADGQRQTRTDTRIDHVALSHYLTLLSEKDAAAIQVFAIKIDRMEALRARYASAHLTALLDDVANTVTDALEASQTVMAYTDDNDLVIATSTIFPLELVGLEARVAQCVQSFDPRIDHGDSLLFGASAGDPVRLQGPKTQRARLAIGRAVDFAEDRALSKHRGPVTYLPRAFGA